MTVQQARKDASVQQARKDAAAQPTLGERLGSAYKRWTLDCIVTIAHAVAEDFSRQPDVYQQIPDGTATQLTDLQGNYGFQADFPDAQIRQRLMSPIFGESDGHGTDDKSAFKAYRLPVLAAAADLAENFFGRPTGVPALRNRVRTALIPFRTHLLGLGNKGGASLSQTDRRMARIFDRSQSILKDSTVSGLFKVVGSIDPNWPLDSTDPQGAQLIEQITTQLPDQPCGVISREWFVRMQRIAAEGSQSIQIIVDVDAATADPGFDIDLLVGDLYAWGSDLAQVGGNRPQQPPQIQPLPTMGAAAGSAQASTTGLSRPVTGYGR